MQQTQAILSQLVTVSHKRCKIGVHSHDDRLMGSRIRFFDWYQNHRPWMNLNDLERPIRYSCRSTEINIIFGAHQKHLNEDRFIVLAATCRPMILVARKIRYMQIGAGVSTGRRRQMQTACGLTAGTRRSLRAANHAVIGCVQGCAILTIVTIYRDTKSYDSTIVDVTIITARQHSLLCRALYQLYDRFCPTVRLLHAGIMPKRLQLRSCGLTGGQPHDSSFLMVNFTTKFQREHTERGRRMREGQQKCSKHRQFLANQSPYLRNGARQVHSHDDRLMGSRIRSFDWYQSSTVDELERP